MAHTVQLLLKARCILSYYTVLLVLKSGQLMANQMWEFCYSYDSGKNRKALVYYSCVNKCLWQSREGRTCKHACVLGLVKWKGRRVFSADWLRDSMWKVPGHHQDLWAYLQKLIFCEKGWLHVDEVQGYIFFFILDFLVRLSCRFHSFFFF